MTVDVRIPDMANGRWYSPITGQTYPWNPSPPTKVFGPAVYTADDMAAWTTGDDYDDLSNDSFCSLSRSITDWGTVAMNDMSTQPSASPYDTEIMRDDHKYALCQSILHRIDGNSSRLTKAIEVFNGTKDIQPHTVFTGQGSRNLDSSWGFTCLLRALAIVGRENYDNAQMDSFLRNVAWPMMQWRRGFNWHMNFWAILLMIASYLEDEALWAHAMAYGEWYVPRGVFHDTYDDGLITPIHTDPGWPNIYPETEELAISNTDTLAHWNNQVASGSPYEANVLYPYQLCFSAERLRDLSHESFGLAGMVQGCRTIVAVGDSVPEHIHARVRDFANYHAYRCLTYENTGTIPTPVGTNGDGTGGGAFRDGWFGAKKYLQAEASADLDAMLVEPTVLARSPEGSLMTVAEKLADAA